MKNMKKLFAILVAALMIVVSMSALAATNDRTVDANLKITGLDDGDTVHLYQVLKWVDGEGWDMVAPFKTKDATDDEPAEYAAGCKAILDKINANTTLTQQDIETLAKIAKTGSEYDTKTLEGTTEYAKSAPVPAMYIALIDPAKADTLYNPIVISADYNGDNGTNEIDSSATLGTIAKKDTVTVKKTADDYTHDATAKDAFTQEPITFTIKTTIPAYSKGYTAPKFVVTDTLSTGLQLDQDSITVSAGTVGSTISDKTDTGFKVTFNSADILELGAPQAVTITYQAILTSDAPYSVNEEDNDVTVEFSNNPDNDEDVTTLIDRTRHFTFDIDGSLFGDSSYKTGELVKVGKDKAGNIIESLVKLSNGTSHGALSGATFGLYTDSDCTTPYTNKVFGGTVTTTDDGEMTIKGLDAGTYYLKEITAPSGYIKDPQTHTIVITADIKGGTEATEKEGQAVTENGITYYVPYLAGYTVTVDGNESSYEMTLSGPNLSSVTPGDSSTELVNTKGTELPSTGGMGTTLFYIGGAVLVLGAVVVMITRRRVRG